MSGRRERRISLCKRAADRLAELEAENERLIDELADERMFFDLINDPDSQRLANALSAERVVRKQLAEALTIFREHVGSSTLKVQVALAASAELDRLSAPIAQELAGEKVNQVTGDDLRAVSYANRDEPGVTMQAHLALKNAAYVLDQLAACNERQAAPVQESREGQT